MFHVLRWQLEGLPLRHENFVHLTYPARSVDSARKGWQHRRRFERNKLIPIPFTTAPFDDDDDVPA